MKVAKWGSSLAVRLPAAVVEPISLKAGDDIEIHVVGTASVRIEKTEDRKQWLDRLRKYRGRLPADFKFDRDEANRRGD